MKKKNLLVTLALVILLVVIIGVVTILIKKRQQVSNLNIDSNNTSSQFSSTSTDPLDQEITNIDDKMSDLNANSGQIDTSLNEQPVDLINTN